MSQKKIERKKELDRKRRRREKSLKLRAKEAKGKTKAMFRRDVINGIKKSEIEAKARVGESYESAAARIAKEKQQAANQHGGAKIPADVSEKIAMLRGALKKD